VDAAWPPDLGIRPEFGHADGVWRKAHEHTRYGGGHARKCEATGDMPMSSEATCDARVGIVADQRTIISQSLNADGPGVAEVWAALKKEVPGVLRGGHERSDDVAAVGWLRRQLGNKRRLRPENESACRRPESTYHFEFYVGGPRSYKCINVTPVPKSGSRGISRGSTGRRGCGS